MKILAIVVALLGLFGLLLAGFSTLAGWRRRPRPTPARGVITVTGTQAFSVNPGTRIASGGRFYRVHAIAYEWDIRSGHRCNLDVEEVPPPGRLERARAWVWRKLRRVP